MSVEVADFDIQVTIVVKLPLETGGAKAIFVLSTRSFVGISGPMKNEVHMMLWKRENERLVSSKGRRELPED